MNKKQPEIGKFQFTPNDQEYLENYIRQRERERAEMERQLVEEEKFKPRQSDWADIMDKVTKLKDMSLGEHIRRAKYTEELESFEIEQDQLGREYGEQTNTKSKRKRK